MSEPYKELINKQKHQNSSFSNGGNRLIHETSPYLLQHAHNPVDWYPWGNEAFEKAKKEDKPVLVSIGYSACHWCHVMERESFEDTDVAAIMNEHFVNIKVDREERPDVDHIYMDAVQAISGQGGWPLNVFLTPDGKPFYGGTYFPPQRTFNRASWREVLAAITSAYHEKREEIQMQAENLTDHLKVSNEFGIASANKQVFDAGKIDEAFRNAMKQADMQWGGFGKAPKFPQSFTIQFLLRYHYLVQKNSSSVLDKEQGYDALDQALLSLNKMIQGGLYDHLGGGFARYSTDTEWLVPHFEKMLYDNALLVTTLAEAFQITNNEVYKDVIEETLEFIEREMMQEEQGFYSALDADSEGEEGKFYVWSSSEVKEVLGNDADLFCRYFDITEAGNWEGKNILWMKTSLKQFSSENGINDEQELQKIIKEGKKKLLQARTKRTRPLLDDKILLSWNALMNIGYSKAYAATGNEHFRQVALKNMEFLMQNLKADNATFYHTWKDKQAKHPAFLDDYAYLIAALVELAQITADYQWLYKAREITEIVLEHFADKDSPYFLYSPDFQTDILVRKKEIYDGATPSGNAVMAINLYNLSILFDNKQWKQHAENMLNSLGDVPVKYPTSFGVWLCALFQFIFGTNEIAIVGQQSIVKLTEVLGFYIPHKIIMATTNGSEFPLLKDKTTNGKTLFYVCKNYACQQPVTSIEELKKSL
ncbi:MAG: thioredoxin domain-containing protein [Chitinophagaceae bacterium]